VKFTGKERDAETGWDFFGARYMASAQGRFASADSEVIPQGLGNPQEWNKYAYTRGNPLRLTDPDGRAPQEGAATRQDAAVRDYAEGRISKEQFEDRMGVHGPMAVGVVGLALMTGGAAVEAGPGIMAAGSALLNWILGHPAETNQAATAAVDVMSPPGTTSLNLTAAADNLGFKSFESMGQTVGGELKGGGSALVSFSKTAEGFGVNIAMVSGPSGTLSKLETGAINAAKAEGASTLTLTASMVKDSMGRLLRQNGFTQEVKNGQPTGRWIKEIKLNQVE